jgi:hypothetical protein
VGSSPPTGYLHTSFSPSVSMAVSHAFELLHLCVRTVKKDFIHFNYTNSALLLQSCQQRFMVVKVYYFVKSVFYFHKV